MTRPCHSVNKLAQRQRQVPNLWYLTWAFKTTGSNYNTKAQLLPTIIASQGV